MREFIYFPTFIFMKAIIALSKTHPWKKQKISFEKWCEQGTELLFEISKALTLSIFILPFLAIKMVREDLDILLVIIWFVVTIPIIFYPYKRKE